MAGDKTPFFSQNVLSEMSEIYPEARVIDIIRDGRDVVVSRMHHLWRRGRKTSPRGDREARRFLQRP